MITKGEYFFFISCILTLTKHLAKETKNSLNSIIVHYPDQAVKTFSIQPRDKTVADFLEKVCFLQNWKLEDYVAVSAKGIRLSLSKCLETLTENEIFLFEQGFTSILAFSFYFSFLVGTFFNTEAIRLRKIFRDQEIKQSKDKANLESLIDDYLNQFTQMEEKERKLHERWLALVNRQAGENVSVDQIPRFVVGMHGESELNFLIKDKEDLINIKSRTSVHFFSPFFL